MPESPKEFSFRKKEPILIPEDELQKRRAIVKKWMENVSVPLDDESELSARGSLMRELGLLAVYADVTKDTVPTIWSMVKQCIPEAEVTFPPTAIQALHEPLSGLPLAILEKTQIVQAGSPVAAAFNELDRKVGADPIKRTTHVFMHPALFF